MLAIKNWHYKIRWGELKMKKKIASGILAVLGVIGTSVTVYGNNEKLQRYAKIATIFVFAILGIVLLFIIREYVVNKLNKLKTIIKELISIKKQLSDTNIKELNEQLVKMDKTITDMIEKTKIFDETCYQTREKVNGCQEEIIAKLNDKSYFQYHTTDVTSQLQKLLDTNGKISEIRIICFGRSGYGEIVQHIEEKNLSIKIKIIICNPINNEFICNKNDLTKIKDLIEIMHRINAEIYLSDVPPAIRASTVYEKDEAIWSATQSYQFKRVSKNKIVLTRPKESLIVTCDEHNSKRDFNGIVKCFESEYERLLENSVHPTIDKDGNIIDDYGTIIFDD